MLRWVQLGTLPKTPYAKTAVCHGAEAGILPAIRWKQNSAYTLLLYRQSNLLFDIMKSKPWLVLVTVLVMAIPAVYGSSFFKSECLSGLRCSNDISKQVIPSRSGRRHLVPRHPGPLSESPAHTLLDDIQFTSSALAHGHVQSKYLAFKQKVGHVYYFDAPFGISIADAISVQNALHTFQHDPSSAINSVTVNALGLDAEKRLVVLNALVSEDQVPPNMIHNIATFAFKMTTHQAQSAPPQPMTIIVLVPHHSYRKP